MMVHSVENFAFMNHRSGILGTPTYKCIYDRKMNGPPCRPVCVNEALIRDIGDSNKKFDSNKHRGCGSLLMILT